MLKQVASPDVGDDQSKECEVGYGLSTMSSQSRNKCRSWAWCTYGVADTVARRRSVLEAALAWSKFQARERVVNLSWVLVRVDVADQGEKDDESNEVTHVGWLID